MDRRNKIMSFIVEDVSSNILYNMDVKDLIVTYVENSNRSFTLRVMGVYKDVATCSSFNFADVPNCKSVDELEEFCNVLATVIMMKFDGGDIDV